MRNLRAPITRVSIYVERDASPRGGRARRIVHREIEVPKQDIDPVRVEEQATEAARDAVRRAFRGS